MGQGTREGSQATQENEECLRKSRLLEKNCFNAEYQQMQNFKSHSHKTPLSAFQTHCLYMLQVFFWTQVKPSHLKDHQQFHFFFSSFISQKVFNWFLWYNLLKERQKPPRPPPTWIGILLLSSNKKVVYQVCSYWRHNLTNLLCISFVNNLLPNPNGHAF